MYQFLACMYDTWCSNKTPTQILIQEDKFIELVKTVGYTEEEAKRFLAREHNKSFTSND